MQNAPQDLRRADGIQRDPRRVERVLRSVARCVATYASAQTIATDAGGEENPIKRSTVVEYLNALEADAVVETRDGRWAAFEVKLGQADVDAAAESLKKLRARVDPDRHGEPTALVVITGWGYTYEHPDGVKVVPVEALAP